MQFSLAYNAHRVLPPRRYLYSYFHALPPLSHKRSISYFSSIKEHSLFHTSYRGFPTKAVISFSLGIVSSILVLLYKFRHTALNVFKSIDSHSRNKTSQSYFRRAQIVYLVNFKLSIKLSAAFENRTHLVRGYRIDTAAK